MTRRQEQAAATRLAILDAARRLFAAQGYRRTTVAQVAEAAGVSVQTIYDSVGSKAALVTSLNDAIRAAADVPTLAAGIEEARSVEDLLRIPPAVTRRILERSGDIVRASFGAADAETELAAVRDEGTRRHRHAMRRIVTRLAELGAIGDEVDQDRLADGFGVLLQPETWLLLIDRYGWTLDEVEEWAVTAVAALVPALAAGGRDSRG